MVITVTRVGGDGSVLTRAVDTASREDPVRWEQLAEDAALHAPPQYRPEPGEPIYLIHAGEHGADVAERDLQGPLRDLAYAVFAEGDA
jgi:hypothetical protein